MNKRQARQTVFENLLDTVSMVDVNVDVVHALAASPGMAHGAHNATFNKQHVATITPKRRSGMCTPCILTYTATGGMNKRKGQGRRRVEELPQRHHRGASMSM
jgi:hypothetical protein